MGQVKSMDRQSVRIPCEVEVVKCRDRPNNPKLSIHVNIGSVSLGSVFFDERYDDGKFWVLDDPRHRFTSRKEAVDNLFERIGMKHPSGLGSDTE